MKLYLTKDYEEMSKKTLELFLKIIEDNSYKEVIRIAITGGKTPTIFYQELIKKLKEIKNLDKINFYNFDEIPYKNDLSKGATIDELEKKFYSPANINKENIHRLNFLNWKEFNDQLKKDDYFDLMLLGIGIDGHFCGNLEGVTKFGDKTRVIKMKDIENNISISKSKNDIFHSEYVTLGPREVMASKNILMMANGLGKADVIDKILNGPVVESVPSSILTLHPNFYLVLDEEANSISKKLKEL